MEKIRRAYAVALTVICCITCLLAGTVIAEKNTRYMCFGEEYKVVDLSDFSPIRFILY